MVWKRKVKVFLSKHARAILPVQRLRCSYFEHACIHLGNISYTYFSTCVFFILAICTFQGGPDNPDLETFVIIYRFLEVLQIKPSNKTKTCYWKSRIVFVHEIMRPEHFFSPGQIMIKDIDNRSPHHDNHPLHLMDHPSSCWSAEIAPNQSEVRWALAGLVPKPTCCFQSQMGTLSKPWLDRVPIWLGKSSSSKWVGDPV